MTLHTIFLVSRALAGLTGKTRNNHFLFFFYNSWKKNYTKTAGIPQNSILWVSLNFLESFLEKKWQLHENKRSSRAVQKQFQWFQNKPTNTDLIKLQLCPGCRFTAVSLSSLFVFSEKALKTPLYPACSDIKCAAADFGGKGTRISLNSWRRPKIELKGRK